MKKIYLAVFLACSIGGAVFGQISEGGLPWSASLKNLEIAGQNKVIAITAPDFEKAKAQDLKDVGIAKPYRGGILMSVDIDIHHSGSLTYLEDGRKIWTANIQMVAEEIQALNFYYDKFALPQGVKYFINNGNGKQILGAFTYKNNNEFNNFANAPVQGGLVKLELDIDAGVNINDIQFHINNIGAFDRGQEVLVKSFGNNDDLGGTALKPTAGESSDCEINAICPQGSDYAPQKNSEARVLIANPQGQVLGFCSGTLITDAAGSCKPYFLTASHCDADNEMTDAHFSQWLIQFNYESPNCDGSGPINEKTITGGNFRARSFYPSFPSPDPHASRLVGDFILLELTSMPDPAWGVYMSGWNRNPFPPSLVNDPVKKYIGFHHPAGDIKKVSYGKAVDPSGQFNQSVVPSTHWFIAFDPTDGGGMEGGSSGSGLFDGDGRLIGDLSGGANPDVGDCANAQGEQMGRAGLYSKLFINWENTFDNTQPGFGAKFRLKDWLDPNNSDVQMADSKAIPCTPTNSVSELEKILENSVLLYPNPSQGILHLKTNFAKSEDLKIEIFNILGSRQAQFQIHKVISANYDMNLSGLPNGIYMVSIATDGAKITRKITISR